jgi:hypothetical protein
MNDMRDRDTDRSYAPRVRVTHDDRTSSGVLGGVWRPITLCGLGLVAAMMGG